MKDKEFDAKLIAYLLGKEELFDEVVDELAEKIKKDEKKLFLFKSHVNI